MKAHQRKIREEKKLTDLGGLFGYPKNPDIKKALLRPVDYNTARQIIKEYEWLGTMGTTQHHYGIYFDGVCAGVVCFGYFQAMNTNNGGYPYAPYIGEQYAPSGIQLTRGACAHWAHEHAGSKLIAYGLRKMAELNFKYVVAFSDPQAGEIGTLYQATNWYYVGSAKTMHYDLYFKNGKLYKNDRDLFRDYGFSGRKDLERMCEQRDYLEIRERKPKGRYIKLIGNKHENRTMLRTLSSKILPYPKRDA